MIDDDGNTVTLADCYPGDIVAIEDESGANVPYIIVQLGAHMGTTGKGKKKVPRWHLVTTLDLQSFERYPETWRGIDTVPVIDIVCRGVWMRDMKFGKRNAHDPAGERDPLAGRRVGGTFEAMARKTDPTFRLEDVLAAFRALEATDDAVVILHDEAAMKLLVAWSHTDQRWTMPESRRPPTVSGRMDALWSWVVAGWDLDIKRIARFAGVPPAIAHAKMAVLVGNRLIYPDGTMAKGAKQAIGVYTARKLGIKSLPKQPERPAPKPTDDRSN